MGALMRSYDWSRTPLGDPAAWPDPLKAAVATCLNSRFPMVVWWGPQLLMLYNDAWQPILGSTKHPGGLGRPGQELWPETWAVVGEQFAKALNGIASWSEDLLLASDRKGFVEESYFTYSHSPLIDAAGQVVGVLSVVSETTNRVLNERRLRTLARLSTVAAESARWLVPNNRMCQELVDLLCQGNPDAPFAALYLVESPQRAHLAASAGMDVSLLPGTVESADQDKWGIAPALRTLSSLTVARAASEKLPGGVWPEPVTQLEVVPIAFGGRQDKLHGILLVGINSRLRLDSQYREFLQLVAAQLGNALSAVQFAWHEHQALESARSASRMKDEFLATVSHELRSPLNAILGWTQILKRGGVRPDLVESAVEVIERNARLQARVVTDLLDISRAISGNLHLDMQEFDINGAIRRAVESVAPDAAAKGIAIQAAASPTRHWVHADPARVEQMLWNLLSNALKFTSRGGQIDVSTEVSDRYVSIRVRDNGEGLDAAFLPHLFERFRKGDGSESRKHDGLGLGLAIVKQLAELQGGRVSASSDGPGRGSAFIVELARTRSQPSYVQDEVRPQESPVSAWSQLSGARVLIVDDQPDSLRVLQQILERAAAHVATASCVTDALRMLDGMCFDVIVTDIAMPHVDGYDFMRELSRRGIRAPVIALTAHALPADVSKATEAGFSAHVPKPIDGAALLAAVSRLACTGHDNATASPTAAN